MVIGYCHKNENVARKRSIATAMSQVATFFSWQHVLDATISFVGIASRQQVAKPSRKDHLWRYIFVAIAYFNNTCFVACSLPWQ
jgi:hypothetical protein